MEREISPLSNLSSLKAQLIEAEEDLYKAKQSSKLEKKRLERLVSQQQITKQQIEFYSHEYQLALENIKDCNWKITKEMCTELRKHPSPSATILEVCEKLMLVLGQPDKSFTMFKNLCKNFGYFKDLMTSVQGQTLPDSVINEILPIWKNQTIIQAKIVKISKCASLLAQWIGFIVEFSLKKETVNTSKRKEPELDKKIKAQMKALNELSRLTEIYRQTVQRLKEAIDNKSEADKEEEMSEKFEAVHESGTKPMGFTMHRGTASGGIMGYSRSPFPNFNDAELYNGASAINPSEHTINYESTEPIGCCRLKFFCF